jgi:dATP pyrophosphohydrolase
MRAFAELGRVPGSTEGPFSIGAERRRYKRPQSVLVLVYTAAGQVLLLRRIRPRDFWQSVTGSLRWGESRQRAACRELFEETGLHAGRSLQDWCRGARFPILGPWRARYAPGTRFNREYWFALRLRRQRKILLNPREHSEYRWLTRPQALRLASSWSNRQAIRLLTRRMRGPV